jgi:hypothetical protein
LKLEVLRHYSGAEIPFCKDPFNQHIIPYTDIRALSVDHLDGKGSEHRKTEKIKDFYWWLKRNNYPEGFQVLCMNCQTIKKVIGKEFRGKSVLQEMLQEMELVQKDQRAM